MVNNINRLGLEELNEANFLAAIDSTIKWASMNELYEAAQMGNIEQIKKLILKKKLDPNVCHPETGQSALQIATMAHQFIAAEELSALGANDNIAYGTSAFSRIRHYQVFLCFKNPLYTYL